MESKTKKTILGLSLLCANLVVLSGFLLYSFLKLRVHVVLANDQIIRIARYRDDALVANAVDSTISLQQILQEFPSGTKQVKDSLLDHLVERQRADAVREIIAHLKAETGQNLGDKPEPWIKQFDNRK